MGRLFTRGPWTLLDQKLRPQFSTRILEIQDARGLAVVKWGGFDGLDRPKPETKANAQLIAAAPEMYEALLAAQVFIRNGVALGFIRMPDADTHDPASQTPGQIDAAIAKANPLALTEGR